MDLNKKKICIFCMGNYGLKTYFFLADRGISIECFGDSSQVKIGKAFRDVPCISYDDCMNLSISEYVIIVCNKMPFDLLQKFKGAGFEAYDCKYVWERCKDMPMFLSVKIWNSPRELKKLHEAVRNFYKDGVIEGNNSSYGETLLKDLILLGVNNECTRS